MLIIRVEVKSEVETFAFYSTWRAVYIVFFTVTVREGLTFDALCNICHSTYLLASHYADTAERTAMAMNENKDPSSPHLDLNTARVFLAMELTAYTLMATAKTGTILMGCTGGEETGKLFWGLSMVQALGYVLFVMRSRDGLLTLGYSVLV